MLPRAGAHPWDAELPMTVAAAVRSRERARDMVTEGGSELRRLTSGLFSNEASTACGGRTPVHAQPREYQLLT